MKTYGRKRKRAFFDRSVSSNVHDTTVSSSPSSLQSSSSYGDTLFSLSSFDSTQHNTSPAKNKQQYAHKDNNPNDLEISSDILASKSDLIKNNLQKMTRKRRAIKSQKFQTLENDNKFEINDNIYNDDTLNSSSIDFKSIKIKYKNLRQSANFVHKQKTSRKINYDESNDNSFLDSNITLRITRNGKQKQKSINNNNNQNFKNENLFEHIAIIKRDISSINQLLSSPTKENSTDYKVSKGINIETSSMDKNNQNHQNHQENQKNISKNMVLDNVSKSETKNKVKKDNNTLNMKFFVEPPTNLQPKLIFKKLSSKKMGNTQENVQILKNNESIEKEKTIKNNNRENANTNVTITKTKETDAWNLFNESIISPLKNSSHSTIFNLNSQINLHNNNLSDNSFENQNSSNFYQIKNQKIDNKDNNDNSDNGNNIIIGDLSKNMDLQITLPDSFENFEDLHNSVFFSIKQSISSNYEKLNDNSILSIENGITETTQDTGNLKNSENSQSLISLANNDSQKKIYGFQRSYLANDDEFEISQIDNGLSSPVFNNNFDNDIGTNHINIISTNTNDGIFSNDSNNNDGDYVFSAVTNAMENDFSLDQNENHELMPVQYRKQSVTEIIPRDEDFSLKNDFVHFSPIKPNAVQGINELRASGKKSNYSDELDSIFDGIKLSSSLSSKRFSLLEICLKLVHESNSEDNNFIFALNQTPFVESIIDVSENELDPIILFCLGFIFSRFLYQSERGKFENNYFVNLVFSNQQNFESFKTVLKNLLILNNKNILQICDDFRNFKKVSKTSQELLEEFLKKFCELNDFIDKEVSAFFFGLVILDRLMLDHSILLKFPLVKSLFGDEAVSLNLFLLGESLLLSNPFKDPSQISKFNLINYQLMMSLIENSIVSSEIVFTILLKEIDTFILVFQKLYELIDTLSGIDFNYFDLISKGKIRNEKYYKISSKNLGFLLNCCLSILRINIIITSNIFEYEKRLFDNRDILNKFKAVVFDGDLIKKLLSIILNTQIIMINSLSYKSKRKYSSNNDGNRFKILFNNFTLFSFGYLINMIENYQCSLKFVEELDLILRVLRCIDVRFVRDEKRNDYDYDYKESLLSNIKKNESVYIVGYLCLLVGLLKVNRNTREAIEGNLLPIDIDRIKVLLNKLREIIPKIEKGCKKVDNVVDELTIGKLKGIGSQIDSVLKDI
ncbi:uncharacterized protein ASCRUDRAFT_73850 [Ascoidea rubescens DSM 1968]|uniref:Uncharacterized protein n=1 Tax=Ascoidea rubescens DSM 1968 TaxID=1344418 RepID=A0A1D2VRC6_9ASCO|nr:hypothetical protein ASCRUDRAFT_73850 [Ascoidea rubescens DSM 1968]ODV64166.1 hypothetical protein ASCRUDRAFT_73850 [Ascoidea rubescens DSM 1968]